ncbi:MAG: squalene/phytoene synthase family protein, partial [Elusimicrobia bacterium]|nr:squalene/phytoene synthase family protein [Elusimicrobiota bacterium]
YARYLGYAFQMTNILRDVGSDFQRNRIYLPMEDLRRFGCEEGAFREKKYSPDFISLMQFEYDRAKAFYRKALGSLHPDDRRNMRPAAVMSSLYESLLEKIREAGFDVWGQKVSLSGWEKASCVLRLFLNACGERREHA